MRCRDCPQVIRLSDDAGFVEAAHGLVRGLVAAADVSKMPCSSCSASQAELEAARPEPASGHRGGN